MPYPLGKGKTKATSGRILTFFPLDFLAEVDGAATAQNRSRSEFIRQACREAVQRHAASQVCHNCKTTPELGGIR